MGPNPEGIAIAAGKAFVANSGLGLGRTFSVIDLSTMRTTSTENIGDNPVAVRVTPQGMVYILCVGFYGDFGDPHDDTPAKIYVVEPLSEVVTDSIFIGGHAFTVAIGNDGVGYVPSTDSVLAIDTRSHRVLGTFQRGSFYGVGVDEGSGDIYLSDAKNYIQPGTVYVYTANAQLRTQFDVGLIPGSFAFKR